MSSNNIKNIFEAISNLNLLDLNKLIKKIEDKFNISGININNLQDNNNNKKDVKEKNEFSLTLLEVGNNKISVIKIIRSFTGLGLKESKNLVDNVPKLIKDNINKIDAEKIKNELEKVGAKIELK